MLSTILVTVGALVMAALAGALLAPSDRSAERDFLRSQWPGRPVPAAPHAAGR
jgi:hypothetical protein